MGVISYRHNYLFVHVPKTGGISIETALLEKGDAELLDARTWPALAEAVASGGAKLHNGFPRVKHCRASELREALGRERFSDFLSFAAVRNPWDRLTSRYYYVRKASQRKSDTLPARLAKPLDEFTRDMCEDRPNTQVDRLLDEEGRLVVDHLLRFETLAEDFERLSSRIFGEPVPLPHLNISRRNEEEAPFSAATIEAVQRVYADDFRVFGYSPEPPL